jgi:hypothetical protein
MRTSPTDKLLQLAAKRQIVHTKDASGWSVRAFSKKLR